MKLVDIATERRVTIVMLTLAVMLFGLVSVARLKVNLLPELTYPTITIRTEMQGAAPQEIENLISRPIEEAVSTIKNVRIVRSVSRTGQSDVTLEFLWGTNMDYAGVEIRDKLDILELPVEAKRPVLLRFDPSSDPIMRLGLGETGQAANVNAEARLKTLRGYADETLSKSLESVPGVAAVKVSGGLEDEIQVLVDQDRLDQLNLPIEQVAARLKAENVNLSGGRLEEGERRFLVRTINEFSSVNAIGNAIVAIRDGKPVRIRDIANVKRGFKERQAIIRVNGKESVELALYKEGDANTVTVARNIESALKQINKDLPENMALTKVYDQSTFISQAIDDVVWNAIIGGLLAALVLYFFLRNAWITAVISVSIPTAIIANFIVMYGLDISLNIMSLGGIALAVGMLVDNSIVVLENISRHREMGKNGLEAARDGTSEVAGAIVASTLTTVAVFFPLVFVQGIAGQLFRDQALTVTTALLFSLLVALTLIPMLAAIGVRAKRSDNLTKVGTVPKAHSTVVGMSWLDAFGNIVGRGIRGIFNPIALLLMRIWLILYRLISRILGATLGRMAYWFQRGFSRVEAAYEPLLDAALRHRWQTLGVAVVLLGLSAALIPVLGVELIPQFSQGEFKTDVRLSPGTPLADTDQAIRQVQAAAAGLPGVTKTYSVAGTGNRLDATPADEGENTGTVNVVLAPGATREAEENTMERLRRAVADVPGAEFKFSRPALLSFKTPLEIEITGYDLNALRRISNTVAGRLKQMPRFADVKSSMEAGHPELQILFDQDRASQLGLQVSDLANRVVSKVRGDVATRYTLRDRKIDVLVRNQADQRDSIANIRKLVVNPESDHPVTLDSVADVKQAIGPSEIRRVSQQRVAVVSANLNFGDLGTAAAEAQRVLNNTPMPAGITARVSGQNQEMQSSFRSMQFALLLAVFLVYIVMASQFESFLHPFVILLSVPLAAIGAIMALFVTGTSINVVVFIGLIMLAGIVVNNAIVLIDLINQLRAKGVDRRDAILQAGRSRLRPILMTTLTTVLGLLPMAIGLGEGAEVRTPLAITVIGGLTVSTLLTLVVIPVMYELLDRKQPAVEAE